MKCFHSADAKLEGHSWKQQFNESVAILNQQIGNTPLLEKPELKSLVTVEKAEALSNKYRMQTFQLGVVVDYSQSTEDPVSDVLDDELSISSPSVSDVYMSAGDQLSTDDESVD